MMKLLNKIKIILLILIFIVLTQGARAQQVTTYFMHKNQLSHILNPAMTSDCKLYFSLPGLSFIQPGFEYGGLEVMDLLNNPSDLRGILEPINTFNLDFNYEILSLGFNIKKSFISFSISNKTNLNIGIPKDFIIFLWEGNKNYIDKELNFNNFNFDFTNYLEYSIGYSYQILDNLKIGGKFKILNGLINLDTEYWDMGIYTSPDTYELDLHSNILLNSSTPINPEFSVENPEVIESWSLEDVFTEYNFFTKNMGLGFDIGAVYDYNDKISLSASFIDLFSYIKWTSGVNNITQNGNYSFSGLDLNPIIYNDDETNEDLFENITDTLINTFEFRASQNNYISKINPKYFLGGNYKVNDWFNAGLLISGKYYNKQNYLAYTLSANSYLVKVINLSASYTIYDSGISNIGMGLGFNIGPLQIFMASDNLLGIKYDTNLNIPWPGSNNNIDFMFGMNFAFGCKNKSEEPNTSNPNT